MRNLIILFDIDDTLIKNERLPDNFENIVDNIRFLKNFGVVFGVCTNRPKDSNAQDIYNKYELNGLIMTEGGMRLNDEGDCQNALRPKILLIILQQ